MTGLLTIDWLALYGAFQINSSDIKCFFNRIDGSTLRLGTGDARIAEVHQSPASFIAIGPIPSRVQYRWVDEFVAGVTDEDLKGRMLGAINGKGAFRRFKDILLTVPDERRRWFELRDEQMRGYVLAWVEEQGIVALNAPNWSEAQPLAPTAEPGSSADWVREWAEKHQLALSEAAQAELLDALHGIRVKTVQN